MRSKILTCIWVIVLSSFCTTSVLAQQSEKSDRYVSAITSMATSDNSFLEDELASGLQTSAPGEQDLLTWAVRYQNTHAVQSLIDYGADPNTTDIETGWSILMNAIRDEQSEIINILIDAGANLAFLAPDGATPAYVAETSNVNFASLVERQKSLVSPEVFFSSGFVRSLPENSSVLKDPTVASLLSSIEERNYFGENGSVFSGNDPHFTFAYGVAPIHLAAFSGDPQAIALILAQGGDIDSIDLVFGITPLMLASYLGHKRAVQTLKQLGANEAVVGFQGETLNEISSLGGQGLKARFRTIETKDIQDLPVTFQADEETLAALLRWAAEGGEKQLVRFLLDKGADPNHSKKNGWTALMLTAASKSDHSKDIAEMLLEAGANVNAMDLRGNTVTHIALATGRSRAFINVLLVANANVSTPNSIGVSPGQSASLLGRKRLAKDLNQFSRAKPIWLPEFNFPVSDGRPEGIVELSKGEWKLVQERLRQLGAYKSVIDGDPGKSTQMAFQAFASIYFRELKKSAEAICAEAHKPDIQPPLDQLGLYSGEFAQGRPHGYGCLQRGSQNALILVIEGQVRAFVFAKGKGGIAGFVNIPIDHLSKYFSVDTFVKHKSTLLFNYDPDGTYSMNAVFEISRNNSRHKDIVTALNSYEVRRSVLAGLTDREITKMLQEDLNRVGCKAGKPDGAWGRGSRSALQRFKEHSIGIELASTDPSVELLLQVMDVDGRVCPLICSVTENKKGNRCVRKTCSAGQRLSSKGSCFTPPPKGARATGCFEFNGQIFCD